MQRRFLAGVPILIIALIFLAFWIVSKSVTPPWRVQLNLYLAYKVTPPEAPIRVIKTIHAGQPWNFTAEMSGATYGNCSFFDVTHCLNVKESLPDPPLPYPVDDMWCALLQTSSPEQETRWVVYVAKHEALYYTDWIIHESNLGIPDQHLMNNLSLIGCSGLLDPAR